MPDDRPEDRFGPTRGELTFRLWVSIAGLALMVFALFHSGVPTGPGLVEVVGMAGLFFGGTAIWTARRLLRAPRGRAGD
jgi:xanthosine utilization system XapX-like protein